MNETSPADGPADSPDLCIPRGFRMAGVYSGVKRNPTKLDLTLILADQPSVAAGVYTTNLFCAAPVTIDRERTPSENVRVIVANSGNANACTGERGLRDARQMAVWAAQACAAEEDQTLVLSTGIIGEHLAMDRIELGIAMAQGQLGRDPSHVMDAARGLLTTDSSHKLKSRRLVALDPGASILGMAKGAGMIGPNMATMLGIVLTDVWLSPSEAQDLLAQAVERTFNCISVEGHMSTNDTVLLLASGAARKSPLSLPERQTFATELEGLCCDLAKTIPADGEGATHLISITVRGCRSLQDARKIGQSVASSLLVKTAIAGCDPNWGRIVSATGYAGVPFQVERVTLDLNGTRIFEHGAPVKFDARELSESIRAHFETRIDLDFQSGDGEICLWTSDINAAYVRLNSEYHT